VSPKLARHKKKEEKPVVPQCSPSVLEEKTPIALACKVGLVFFFLPPPTTTPKGAAGGESREGVFFFPVFSKRKKEKKKALAEF